MLCHKTRIDYNIENCDFDYVNILLSTKIALMEILRCELIYQKLFINFVHLVCAVYSKYFWMNKN